MLHSFTSMNFSCVKDPGWQFATPSGSDSRLCQVRPSALKRVRVPKYPRACYYSYASLEAHGGQVAGAATDVRTPTLDADCYFETSVHKCKEHRCAEPRGCAAFCISHELEFSHELPRIHVSIQLCSLMVPSMTLLAFLRPCFSSPGRAFVGTADYFLWAHALRLSFVNNVLLFTPTECKDGLARQGRSPI